jgi:17beta-estradiol 17-dehydrogenase / very-long-chain 3-oxoacyl-CoA reductase
MSSIAGRDATPMMSVYSATKGFVWRFAEALSEEVKSEGISVLLLHPYYVKSAMSGFRKTSFQVCAPDEFARYALTYLGRQTNAQPYWPHLLLDAGFYFLPTFVKLKLLMGQMKGVIFRLEKRKRRQQQEEQQKNKLNDSSDTDLLISKN